jgi:hypothetical protein
MIHGVLENSIKVLVQVLLFHVLFKHSFGQLLINDTFGIIVFLELVDLWYM